MSAEQSLIQFILDLLRDPQKLAEFKDDPQGVLASCGLSEVSAEDVRDAIVLAQDNDDISFDRDYNTGGGSGGGSGSDDTSGGDHSGGDHQAPPPIEHPKPGEDPVEYINKYVTNNHHTYDVDDRDTIVDNSINQNIDTGGGDFDQEIEINSAVASGDGAVAAGGDIEDSTITTGDDNIVGDDNQVVSGDDNTVAFGDGSAYDVGDVSADDGAGVSFGGDATGNRSTDDSFNTDEETTTNETSTSYEDSFNEQTDASQRTVSEDSYNNDVLSNNELEVAANADVSL